MGIFNFFKRKQQKTYGAMDDIEPIKNSKEIKVGHVYINKTNINFDTVKQMCDCFIAFDVETTGLDSSFDRIIELGAVKFEYGKPTEKFNTLVNPNILIPKSASNVNHITNEMVSRAPTEKDVYSKFLEFIGNAAYGETVMCAHNARFDFEFLKNTLTRLGYDANIIYSDTLGLSRKYINGLENYKLGTIEEYLGLQNDNAHRAASDALISGEILCDILCRMKTEIGKEREAEERTIPNEEELEICGVIQNIIKSRGGDTSWIRYIKRSKNYIDVNCIYAMFIFKIAKRYKYVVVSNKYAENVKLPKKPCPASEGGENYIRVLFDSPFDLEELSEFIYDKFCESYQLLCSWIDSGKNELATAKEAALRSTKIKDNEIPGLLKNAQTRIEESAKILIEQEKIDEEKAHKKCEKLRQRQEKLLSDSIKKKAKQRRIIQMTDNGEIINEYESATIAAHETGINIKCISDTAKGVQKHAGGFCWKYQDEM